MLLAWPLGLGMWWWCFHLFLHYLVNGSAHRVASTVWPTSKLHPYFSTEWHGLSPGQSYALECNMLCLHLSLVNIISHACTGALQSGYHLVMWVLGRWNSPRCRGPAPGLLAPLKSHISHFARGEFYPVGPRSEETCPLRLRTWSEDELFCTRRIEITLGHSYTLISNTGKCVWRKL